MSTNTRVHSYESADLMARMHKALEKAGLAEKQVSIDELAPLDQFHSRGLAATQEIAESLPITSATKVLDVGSGLGGPARYLAARYGCSVRGIDMTQSYVEVANYLAERTGLNNLVQFDCANALALPFPDASFDLVWTQHVAMNILDRAGLYREIFRVLTQDGRLAIYDVLAGPTGPVHFPVPWSTLPETSFLMTPTAMQKLIHDQGFKTLSWRERTEEGIAWFAEIQKRMRDESAVPSPLGLNIAVGPDFAFRAGNLGRSLIEGRALLVEAIFQRA